MRIAELLDIFVKKSSANPILLDIVMPLLQLAKLTAGSDQQQPLHAKVTSIIKSRLNNVKDYPKSVSKSSVHEVMKQVLEMAALPATSKEISNLCGGSALLLVKMSLYLAKDAHEKEVKHLAGMFETVLHSFLTTKHTNIGIELFKSLADRYFDVAWRLCKQLIKGLDNAGEYQVVKGFELLAHIFSRLPQKISYAETCKDHVKSTSKVLKSLVTKLDQEEFRGKMNPGRFGQIVKTCNDVVKRSKKVLGSVCNGLCEEVS
jgi:hypothetical protein